MLNWYVSHVASPDVLDTRMRMPAFEKENMVKHSDDCVHLRIMYRLLTAGRWRQTITGARKDRPDGSRNLWAHTFMCWTVEGEEGDEGINDWCAHHAHLVYLPCGLARASGSPRTNLSVLSSCDSFVKTLLGSLPVNAKGPLRPQIFDSTAVFNVQESHASIWQGSAMCVQQLLLL